MEGKRRGRRGLVGGRKFGGRGRWEGEGEAGDAVGEWVGSFLFSFPTLRVEGERAVIRGRSAMLG